MSEGALIRRLGEAGWERGRVGTLDLLAHAGLPVPEGVVLARRAHERSLGTSGALHGRLVLGSVSEAVVHHATCPVLVVRGAAWPPWRIVIGDDGSRAAKKAGELALRIASLYGAGSILVRAYRG